MQLPSLDFRYSPGETDLRIGIQTATDLHDTLEVADSRERGVMHPLQPFDGKVQFRLLVQIFSESLVALSAALPTLARQSSGVHQVDLARIPACLPHHMESVDRANAVGAEHSLHVRQEILDVLVGVGGADLFQRGEHGGRVTPVVARFVHLIVQTMSPHEFLEEVVGPVKGPSAILIQAIMLLGELRDVFFGYSVNSDLILE